MSNEISINVSSKLKQQIFIVKNAYLLTKIWKFTKKLLKTTSEKAEIMVDQVKKTETHSYE